MAFFCRNQSKTQSFIFLHASWPLLIYCIYIRTHKTGHRDKRYRTYLESKTRVIDVNAYLDIIPETELNGKVSWLDTLDTGLVQVKSQAVTILTHINIHTYMMLGLVNIEYIQSTMSNELSSITEWMFVLRYFNRSVYYFRIRYQHGATRILRTSDSASLIMPVRKRPAGSLRPTTPPDPTVSTRPVPSTRNFTPRSFGPGAAPNVRALVRYPQNIRAEADPATCCEPDGCADLPDATGRDLYVTRRGRTTRSQMRRF